MPEVIHNPDRYMADLRQILAQGKKRIGLLLGAGAPVALQVNEEGLLVSSGGRPSIPAVAGLTEAILDGITFHDRSIIEQACDHLGSTPNIERILSQVRLLSKAIGGATVHSYNGNQYHALATEICKQIGAIVDRALPPSTNAYTQLVAWVADTVRQHPVEIFTPNYDLLLEEALERAFVPYFDGFSGANLPFFDAATVANNDLPARWVRLWKLHGSLGWSLWADRVVRRGGRDATQLIYPDHLKYDQTQKLPYAALFDRLRSFLSYPDTLLISCGFSYCDAHITAVIEEALCANPNASVIACQFQNIEAEQEARALAARRPNFSVYARDAAIISCTVGTWSLGDLPNDQWIEIRRSYWNISGTSTNGTFILGDFSYFARFFAHAQSQMSPDLGEHLSAGPSQRSGSPDAEPH